MLAEEQTVERRVVREAARYWWVFLVSGILWLIISWIVLRMNETSVVAVGVLLGVVFLFAGINEVGAAMVVPGGWRVWHWIMAVIFFLGGLWGLIEPVNTFFALASVLGLILILYGSFEIVLAIASHGVNPYWWLNLIVGILLILLAFWVIGWGADSASGNLRTVLQYLSVTDHMDSFTRGLVDTKDLVYYGTFIILALFLTSRSLESKRWRG